MNTFLYCLYIMSASSLANTTHSCMLYSPIYAFICTLHCNISIFVHIAWLENWTAKSGNVQILKDGCVLSWHIVSESANSLGSLQMWPELNFFPHPCLHVGSCDSSSVPIILQIHFLFKYLLLIFIGILQLTNSFYEAESNVGSLCFTTVPG